MDSNTQFVFLQFHLSGSASCFVGSDHENKTTKVYESNKVDKIISLAQKMSCEKNLTIIEETENKFN